MREKLEELRDQLVALHAVAHRYADDAKHEPTATMLYSAAFLLRAARDAVNDAIDRL